MDPARLAWLHQPTRHRILLATEEQFAAAGYDTARVDDIAAAAGVSKSHLYYHFPGKADLLAALVELRTAELLQAKDALPASALDPTRIADTIARGITDLLVPHRAFLRIVLVESLRHPDATRPVLAAVDAALDDTEDRFRAAGLALAPGWRTQFFHLGLLPACYLVGRADGPPPAREVRALAEGIAILERSLLTNGSSDAER